MIESVRIVGAGFVVADGEDFKNERWDGWLTADKNRRNEPKKDNPGKTKSEDGIKGGATKASLSLL